MCYIEYCTNCLYCAYLQLVSRIAQVAQYCTLIVQLQFSDVINTYRREH